MLPTLQITADRNTTIAETYISNMTDSVWGKTVFVSVQSISNVDLVTVRDNEI